jgi:hypothetical protein
MTVCVLSTLYFVVDGVGEIVQLSFSPSLSSTFKL